jgi:gas vesicle protein
MTLEQLIAMGLTEEVAKKVLEAYQASLKDKFIPIERFKEVNDTKKELQDKVKGNEELEKAVKDLQEANKTTKEQYEAKIKDMKIDAAIREKLTDAKYPELLMSKFDKKKLTVSEDGTVLGIDEQLTPIKEQYKDMFDPNLKGREPFNKDKTPPGVKNPWKKETWNLTEQGKLLREDPELAKQLMAAAN